MLATQPCKLASTTGYRVYRPATQPCTVASITGYRVYRLHSLGTAYPTPNWLQSHPTQSIQLCVDSGAGRQQVSTNMASTDWLQSSNHQTSLLAIQPYFHQNRLQSDHLNHWLQSLPTRYRLYNLASPKPVTESTQLAKYRPVAV